MSAERLAVPAAGDGERLDRFLAARRDLPPNPVQRWIAEGRVRVDAVVARPSQRLATGAVVEWEPSPPREQRLLPEEGELFALWEDDHLLVLDKPAGLTVHPGAGRPTG